MNDKMPPVAFRDAKPINRKERHPFTGEPTHGDAGPEQPPELDFHHPIRDSDLGGPTEPAAPVDVLTLLRRKRAELDSAIYLIEQLLR